MSRSIAAVALVLALGLAPLAAQPAFQVKDIKTTVEPTSPFDESFTTDFVELDGAVYFPAQDGIHGTEIWRADGSAAGTHVVKDLCPGICSSRPLGLTRFGSSLYFESSVDSTLFKSDGTDAGTVPVFTTPSPLAQGFYFRPLAVLGTTLLLTGGDLASQEGLWATDGTAAGTSLLKSFPGNGSRDPQLLNRLGNTVLFSADDGTHGRELWRTDGTAAGTALVRDLTPGPQGTFLLGMGFPPYLTPAAGGKMFFVGSDPDHGAELWATDGTDAGTALVKDIAPGPSSSFLFSLTAVGNAVYFARSLAGDVQLWKSDGTEAGTVPVRTGFSGIGEMTAVGDRLFFEGSDSTHGLELWTSDGTTAGTVLVADIHPAGDSFDGQSAAFFALGNRVVFFADDGTHGREPWSSDGTAAGTVLLADLNPGPGGSYGPGNVFARARGTSLAGVGLFVAYTPSGWYLYGTDGTPGGTALVQGIDTQASSLPPLSRGPLFTDLAGTALVRADDGVFGRELWKSDGTPAGTSLVEDLLPGPDGSQLYEIQVLGARAFFGNSSSASGSGLWTSDGTPAGTGPVPAAASSSTANGFAVTPLGGRVLYFRPAPSAYELWQADAARTNASLVQSLPTDSDCCSNFASAVSGRYLYFLLPGSTSPLYRTDGTPGGTVQVSPGPFFNYLGNMASAGPFVFFLNGNQLYQSDGTAAGTHASVSSPNPISVADRTFVAAGSRLFFTSGEGTAGQELWTSDGTAAGTVRVKDINPVTSSFPTEVTAVGNRVFFTADDGVHGRELWVSDGTPAGTHLVKDIQPGTASPSPQNLARIGHLLFFAADDGVHGLEPWQSDGTAAGTRMVQDVGPGALPSSPAGFAAAGLYVYFAANDGTHGFEPWALPRASLGGFLTATLTVAGQTEEGGAVTYTLTVTNAGAGPALDNPGDEVADVLRPGLTLLSATAGSGTVTTDLPGNRIAWNGALDPGASVTITIQAQVWAGTFGVSLANQATLAFDADGNGTNESSGVSDDPARPGAADTTSFSPATAALGFYTLPPCRALDTRGGTPLAAGAARTIALAGTCGVPAGARAIAGNFTVVNPTAPGFLTVFPTGIPTPPASTLNFSRGQTRTNNAVFALSGGKLDAKAGLLGGGQLDLVLDVVGYFQ
jgi:uncharacterized repeat protein (TIGR01451 family)